MKLSLIAFTAVGGALAHRLANAFAFAGHQVVQVCVLHGESRPPVSLMEWTKAAFAESDGLVFVGATGIAVRAIAPLLNSKLTDPAVLSIDERGRFVVSLVSGHVGGANRLAAFAAEAIGATPVISTATDLNDCFAVDVWAKEQGLVLAEMPAAKAISAALLDGERIGFCSDFPVEENLPHGFAAGETGPLGVCVTLGEKTPFLYTLRAVPRIVTLGIGCRKGVSAEAIARAVREVLAESQIDLRAVKAVASIDLKAGEPGILAFCENEKLSFVTFSAAALSRVEGNFTQSSFVREVTGVDNVCERAALTACPGGRLAIAKHSGGGITVAAAIENWRVRFGR